MADGTTTRMSTTLKCPEAARRLLPTDGAHNHRLQLPVRDALRMERMATSKERRLAAPDWPVALHTLGVRVVDGNRRAGLFSLLQRGLNVPDLEEQTRPIHSIALVEAVVGVTDLRPRSDDAVPLPCFLPLVPPHAVVERAGCGHHVVMALRAGPGRSPRQVIVLEAVVQDAHLPESGAAGVGASSLEAKPGFG